MFMRSFSGILGRIQQKNKLTTVLDTHVVSAMIGQKKISSFFNTLSPKRDNTSHEKPQKTEEPDAKKARIDKSSTPPKAKPEDQENVQPKTPPASKTGSNKATESSPSDEIQSTPPTASPPASSPLSPEQKQRMDENKLKAEMKCMEKKTHGLVTGVGITWFKALKEEFAKPYFVSLGEFVSKERRSKTIYPPVDQVFSFTNACELKKVRVVILGQDPYHGPNQAHGICFSVQKGVNPPPSLLNMYKELEVDIEGFKHPGHGYLMGWAEQGVLMLNAVLTVQAGNANSHKDKGWEKFTDAVVSWISKNLNGVVFMLWGGYAQKKGASIDKKKHHILKGVHPSPLSAHRGYFGCKHFSKCNELLKKQGHKAIDWKNLP